MTKIRILPEILSNKIAAGEVVERPASVVKELVENALDAESTRIIIEIEGGGRSLIRVSDNGIGMTRDDAMLSIERYATSKIYKDTDLFSINTLGFRGEALPSIASVSRFSVVTREKTADTGTAIDVEGGKLKKVSEIGAPPGTMVTVKQLFFNIPVRRKFLKTISTEMGHIADIVASIALGRPEIQFRLLHNGKAVKRWPASADPGDRVVDVLGKEVRNNLHPLNSADNRTTLSGWICNPRIMRRTSKGIYTYVNGRYVRDPIIQHALMEGYAGRLMKGQFPVAVLWIQVPFDRVDVNVHPTKNHVRFADANAVHAAVKAAVSNTLGGAGRPGWISIAKQTPSVSERISPYSKTGVSERYVQRTTRNAQGATRNTKHAEVTPEESAFEPRIENRKSKIENQAPLWDRKPFGDLRVIGQLHETYILCESGQGLVLVDQHAAHERIRFEQLKSLSDRSEKASQKLIVSETLDLSYVEAETIEKLIPELKAFGLDIDPFGGNTFVIKSIPALLAGRAVKPLIMEMMETVTEMGTGLDTDKVIEQCLIVMACHGTIRARQALSEKEMRALLAQLDECEKSSHCPHGRPIWIAWPLRLLEKSFHRIG